MTLSNGDIVNVDNYGRVAVVKRNGCRYLLASLNCKGPFYGAYMIGTVPTFFLSKRTMATVLKIFYPDLPVNYLTKYGYIDH